MRRAAAYLLVSSLWGCTNPLLKAAQNDPRVQSMGFLRKLVTPAILVPIAVNQCGSVLFLFLLATEPLSFAVPVVNSLTLVFTTATAQFLGERLSSPLSFVMGAALILTGTYMCLLG